MGVVHPIFHKTKIRISHSVMAMVACWISGEQLFLPPANEVYKGYVSQVSVCPQGWGGVCPIACWDTPLGRHPPEHNPPGANPLGHHLPGSRHPLGEDTPWNPPCTVHAGRYGQQAGGTHPTGMHTFLRKN